LASISVGNYIGNSSENESIPSLRNRIKELEKELEVITAIAGSHH